MASAAVGRLQKLLTLCDFHLSEMEKKANNPNELPTRDILSLARMILNLQKDLEKYAAIVYPATEIVSPVAMGVSNAVLEKEAISDSSESEELKTALLLKESLSTLVQDLDALQVAALASSPSTKKQAKAQKFSQAFFQKRPQAATL
jgi:hypothetical protein